MSSKKLKQYRGLLKQYDVDEAVLGNGSRGKVVRGVRRSDNLEVAIKIMSKRELSSWSQAAVAREVFILRTVNHENVVQFIDALEDQRNVYIVLEYLKGGDLYTRLQKNNDALTESVVLNLAEQMLEAVKALHCYGFSHRDIKLENFVFATDEKENKQVLKLIDFGLAFIRRPGCESSKLPCGTVQYCSPEVAAQRKYVPEQVDMWGLGVVLYALLSRRLPFHDQSRTAVLSKIKNSPVSFNSEKWNMVSPQTKELINRLLSKKGADRPSVDNAMSMVRTSSFNLTLSDVDELEQRDLLSPLTPANGRLERDDSADNGNESSGNESSVLSTLDAEGVHDPGVPVGWSQSTLETIDTQNSGHKRQRSSSHYVKSVLEGLGSSTKRLLHSSTVTTVAAVKKSPEVEDILDNEDDDSISSGSSPENESFLDGLCQAYGGF